MPSLVVPNVRKAPPAMLLQSQVMWCLWPLCRARLHACALWEETLMQSERSPLTRVAFLSMLEVRIVGPLQHQIQRQKHSKSGSHMSRASLP